MKPKQKLLDKLTDLLVNHGLTIDGARERVNNIVQILIAGIELDWIDVSSMISPTEVHEGVDDPVSRMQAASEFLRIYYAETAPNVFSARRRLEKLVGDTRDHAKEWLRMHDYFLRPIRAIHNEVGGTSRGLIPARASR